MDEEKVEEIEMTPEMEEELSNNEGGEEYGNCIKIS